MPSISEIKNIIVAVALAVIVGFGLGFYVKAKFAEADQVDRVIESRHETAQNIQTSAAASQKLDEKVAKSDGAVQQIRTIIKTRIVKEKANETIQMDRQISCGALDVGTVRLLNAARTGAAVDSAAVGDEASQTPSGIAVPELLDNDLEVVQLYRELAAEHDTLVDYVESLMKKQAKQ